MAGVLTNMLGSAVALGLLPLGWLGCYLLCRRLAPGNLIADDRRLSAILASAMWGTFLVLLTELLSALALLNRAGLLIGWGLTDILLWCLVIGLDHKGTRPGIVAQEWARVRTALKAPAVWPVDLRLMLLAVVLLVGFLGIVALLTPTGNWDSIAYHLPRVMRWSQQETVSHYPSMAPAQLHMGPWSAFLQTHVFLLWGTDRFANCIQWVALIGCLFNSTFLVRCLVDSRGLGLLRAEVFTALLVATLPTAIVESITPQTDVVSAFWLSGTLSLFFVLLSDPQPKACLLGAGATIGLGILTKITYVIYLAPFVAVGAAWLLFRRRALATATWLALAIALAGAVNLPHAIRNHRLFGSPVGSNATRGGAQNQAVSIGGLTLNLLRSLGLHTGTGIPVLTRTSNSVLERLGALTGRPFNDPEITLYTRPKFAEDEFVVYDSETGNPYHLGLLILAAVMSLARAPRNWRLILYVGLTLASAVLFCIIIRWTPWNARYHLPYFVGLMPVVAAVFIPLLPRWSLNSVAAGLVVFAGVIIVYNRSRPIFDPKYLAAPVIDQMVAAYYPPVAENVEMLSRDVMSSGCRDVGLHLEGHDPEYIFWVGLRDKGFTGKIKGYLVDNETAGIPDGAPPPCVVITLNTNPPPPSFTQQFPFAYRYGPIIVFWSESASRWRELNVFDYGSKSIRALTPEPSRIPFTRGLLQLELRTPRPGTLRWQGKVVSEAGKEQQKGRLRAYSPGLFEQRHELGDEQLRIEVSAPAGRTTLNFALEDSSFPATNVFVENFVWQWTPD